MKKFKSYLGLAPTAAINWILRRQVPRERLRSLVLFINDHPNWFENVDRKIRTSTNFGFEIYCDRKETIGQAILFSGQWEGLLSRTLAACLNAGDFAVDVGANIGYDTLLMSNAVGATGTVLAFEPDFENMSQLLRNIEAHAHKNIIVESLALSNENILTTITRAGEDNRGVSNLRLEGSGESQPILTARLDSLLPTSPSRRIAVIKLDVEGFEYKALQGAGDLIKQVEHVVCEINHQFLLTCGSSAKMLFEYMQAAGFTSYCAEPSSDAQWEKNDHNYIPTAARATHFDVLFCRRVTERLRPLISTNAAGQR